MRISTASSVFVRYSLDDAIRLTAEAGYDRIDIWGGRPHAYRRDLSPQDIKRLRAQLAGAGLAVPSIMPAFYRYPHSLVSPNETVRQDSLSYMAECAENGAALGADVLLIVPSHSLSGQPREDAWQRLVDSVAAVCEIAARAGLRPALEAVNREVSDLVSTATDALRVLEAVGDDTLGVALDTGHMHLSDEPPAEAVDRLGDRLFQVHTNDNDGQHQQNLILGEGTFPFDAFVGKLHASGYDGFLSAELGWHYTRDPFPAVHKMAQVMRESLARL